MSLEAKATSNAIGDKVLTAGGVSTSMYEGFLYGIRNNPLFCPLFITIPEVPKGGNLIGTPLTNSQLSTNQLWYFTGVPPNLVYQLRSAATMFPMTAGNASVPTVYAKPQHQANNPYGTWQLEERSPGILPLYCINQNFEGKKIPFNLSLADDKDNTIARENDAQTFSHQWSFIPKYELNVDIGGSQTVDAQPKMGNPISMMAGATTIDNSKSKSDNLTQTVTLDYKETSTATLTVSNKISYGASLSITVKAGGTFLGVDLGGDVTTSFNFAYEKGFEESHQASHETDFNSSYTIAVDGGKKKYLSWECKKLGDAVWPVKQTGKITGYMFQMTDHGAIVKREVFGDQLQQLIKIENYFNPQSANAIILDGTTLIGTIESEFVADFSYEMLATISDVSLTERAANSEETKQGQGPAKVQAEAANKKKGRKSSFW